MPGAPAGFRRRAARPARRTPARPARTLPEVGDQYFPVSGTTFTTNTAPSVSQSRTERPFRTATLTCGRSNEHCCTQLASMPVSLSPCRAVRMNSPLGMRPSAAAGASLATSPIFALLPHHVAPRCPPPHGLPSSSVDRARWAAKPGDSATSTVDLCQPNRLGDFGLGPRYRGNSPAFGSTPIIWEADTVHTGHSGLSGFAGYAMRIGPPRRPRRPAAPRRAGVLAQALPRAGRRRRDGRSSRRRTSSRTGRCGTGSSTRTQQSVRPPIQPGPPALPHRRLRRPGSLAEPAAPDKKTGTGRYDGDGYLQLLSQWDAENRAEDPARGPPGAQPPVPLGEAAALAPPAAPTAEAKAGPGVWQRRPPPSRPATRRSIPRSPSRPGAIDPARVRREPPPPDQPARFRRRPRQKPARPDRPDKATRADPKVPDPTAGRSEGTGSVPDVERSSPPGRGADDYLNALATNQQGYRIKVEQAVELGLINSREFQDRREDLYLAALPVTLERFSFAAQAFFTEQIVRDFTGSGTRQLAAVAAELGTRTGVGKQFPTGGRCSSSSPTRWSSTSGRADRTSRSRT